MPLKELMFPIRKTEYFRHVRFDQYDKALDKLQGKGQIKIWYENNGCYRKVRAAHPGEVQ